MPRQVQMRRGTTAEHATFTGAAGEVTVDTSKRTLVVHDGATAGGFALAQEQTLLNRTGNLVWVDQVNGNDGTGTRGMMSKPFLTLNGAKAAAQAGDTVVVLPGTYNERQIAKNGVNWHFVAGTVVSYSGGGGGG